MAAAKITSVKVAPAPSFSFGVGQPALATIYGSHYSRLMAVMRAARSGDSLLIRLALAHFDKWGTADEGRPD